MHRDEAHKNLQSTVRRGKAFDRKNGISDQFISGHQ